MPELAQKKCKACKDEDSALKADTIIKLSGELGQDWEVVHEHHIEKEFKFKDFKSALKFVNQVGELAENEGHHPDLHLSWGCVRVVLWTHSINGLSENDFILAAKIDLLPN